jgi:transcription-repair coupling factor (superfamily II helicase)
MEELGSGFFLAMHDLEIRGAGEVLGENQSGNITEIGFSLYAEMLENAVRFLKEKKPINENLIETSKIDINLHMPALLPKTYCPDINERLIIYKKLSESTNITEINEMEEELIDRFGLIPLEAKTLLLTHKIRIKSIAADLVKLDMTEDSIIGTFAKEPKIDIDAMLDSIKKDNSFKITGPNQLKYFVSNNSLASYQLNSELFFSKILGGKITLDY